MVDAERYVGEGGDIQLRQLMATLGGSVVVALGAAYLSVVETLVALNVGVINAGGGFARELVRATFGNGAALVVDSWRSAFVASIEFGAVAPFVLVVEGLLIFTIAFAAWNRGPWS